MMESITNKTNNTWMFCFLFLFPQEWSADFKLKPCECRVWLQLANQGLFTSVRWVFKSQVWRRLNQPPLSLRSLAAGRERGVAAGADHVCRSRTDDDGLGWARFAGSSPARHGSWPAPGRGRSLQPAGGPVFGLRAAEGRSERWKIFPGAGLEVSER